MAQAIASNKKAFRDYNLFDKWEAGIVLSGGEVKSIRAGHVNFTDSFARVTKDEIFLYNLRIEPYTQAGYTTEEAERPRKLLLNKKEILKIIGHVSQKKLALIPTKIYFSARGFVKVEIALGKGKKQYDKRESIKKRTMEREISRIIKRKKQ